MSLIELKVPDIGGHENVDIIAVEIKAGDTVAVDDTLITLETDKATMDVPAEAAGVVKEVKVKVGDKISEGGVIAVIEGAGAAATNYVKDGDARVIAHTKVVGGGEKDSVTFKTDVLEAGGDYDFFCSFPGHYAVMRGKVVVE